MTTAPTQSTTRLMGVSGNHTVAVATTARDARAYACGTRVPIRNTATQKATAMMTNSRVRWPRPLAARLATS